MANQLQIFSATIFLLISSLSLSTQQTQLFFPGFEHADTNLTLTGATELQKNGLIRLTNDTSRIMGHAFYASPFLFRNTSTKKALSFSTCFAFSIVPEYPKLGGHGLAFTISTSKDLRALPSQYLGLLNASDVGNFSNHVFAVEFDTVQDFEFGDINDNHIGIDINNLRSNASVPSAYYVDKTTKQNITLKSGDPIQTWIDYDSIQNVVSVTISPTSEKPIVPILIFPVDLSQIFEDYMYVGFSSSTGLLASSHFLLGWSFKVNGQAQNLDLSSLPSLPGRKQHHTGLTIGVSVTAVGFALILMAAAIFYVIRKTKDTDVIEDWELELGPHRYSYQELKKATRDFSENELLGHGGFGQVYKGLLPDSNIQIAVKKIFSESKQGLREFVSEIGSIGRLRHRNLVQLLGWCRRKDDLLIVYDFMANGSLDRYLFDEPKMVLSWDQRFKIIKDVASGLLYLHEGYEQVVIHRDVKASNVLLDSDLSGRLGDFGLARLYEHGSNPSTTRVVGTLGYLAPEVPRTGKATASSDVFAFGALLLEVACGRRPIEPKASPEELVLVDLIWDRFKDGHVLNVVDHRLRGDFNAKEALMVLKLGIMCSNYVPPHRPSMRQVLKYLDGEVELPESLWPPNGAYDAGKGHCEGFDAFLSSLASSSSDKMSSKSLFIENGDVGTSFASLSTSSISFLHDGPR